MTQSGPRAGSLKVWIQEARPQYFLLPVVLILVGTSSAAWVNNGAFNPVYAFIALLGLVLCHASVNILNDYFDFKSGVDLKTLKTPFSGGSGILPAGKLTAKQVLWYGIICFAIAIPIGIFFAVVEGWLLLPLLALGGICILLYTSIILKNLFPEWSPGLGLGILPVLGAYFVQTGNYSWTSLIASVPSGFLVLNLLLLNEFPDAEADLIGNKKTLPITAGKKRAAVVYSAFVILTFLWIIGAVIFSMIPGNVQVMPAWCLLSLGALPFAYKSIRGSFGYNDLNKILPAMQQNVLLVLVTQLLLGIGFILGTVF
jgi:1,4-dihydroxy-2-naphthoate polyprenyltransferase